MKSLNRSQKLDRVFIGVPIHAGGICSGTADTIITAASSTVKTEQQVIGLSLLARNFNTLWCRAYMEQFDYFIMLHGDIIVKHRKHIQGSWVDLLVARMKEMEAAVISAVVPIKCPHGTTSTAMCLTKQSPHKLRRMTVRELDALPQYFTRDQLCSCLGYDHTSAGPMLINTACMCIDLKNYDWAGLEWPGFQIVDHLVWNLAGHPQPYTIPEDWGFSWWLWENGLPYFATTELGIGHVGTHVFDSEGRWGREIDPNQPQLSMAEYAATGDRDHAGIFATEAGAKEPDVYGGQAENLAAERDNDSGDDIAGNPNIEA